MFAIMANSKSFFGSLKKGRIKKQLYKNRDLATADVAPYIDTFYIRIRRHSHLGGLSPEQFEAAHKPRRKGLHSRALLSCVSHVEKGSARDFQRVDARDSWHSLHPP